MQSFDTFLFTKMNSLAGSAAWLDNLFIFITLNLYWIIWLLFILMLILTVDDVSFGRRVKRFIKRTSEIKKLDGRLFLSVVLSSGIGYAASHMIGWLVSRPRPFVAIEGAIQLITDPVSQKSFPSDHSLLSFAMALSVFYVHKRWGSVFLALAALVAVSRVWVGVHYPLDIAAGALLAWIVSWLVKKVIDNMKWF